MADDVSLNSTKCLRAVTVLCYIRTQSTRH